MISKGQIRHRRGKAGAIGRRQKTDAALMGTLHGVVLSNFSLLAEAIDFHPLL